MPAKRFYIATLPVEHINGKMAPVKYKCSNVAAGEPVPDTSFWYGYRRKTSPFVSRYGIRTEHRKLEEHPYTIAETENRDLFRAALLAVNANHKIPANWELCREDFMAQEEYRTQIGFAIAMCRENAGQWLDAWTA